MSGQDCGGSVEGRQEHYFTSTPHVAAVARRVEFGHAGRAIELESSSGLFSADHLDDGTRVLLEHAPPAAAGSVVLDLGCGYGPIACVLASTQPTATVWAIDVNDRALELTARNAAVLSLGSVRACRPPDVPSGLLFDAIYSNPPIRIGKDALHALLEEWLGRLRPRGHGYMVVHKNLGSDSLHRWLVAQGWPTVRLTSIRGFRVLDVTTA